MKDQRKQFKEIQLDPVDIQSKPPSQQKADELNSLLEQKRKPTITFHYRIRQSYDKKTSERQSQQEQIPFKSFLVQKYLNQQNNASNSNNAQKEQRKRYDDSQNSSTTASKSPFSRKLQSIHLPTLNQSVASKENIWDQGEEEKRGSKSKAGAYKNSQPYSHDFYGSEKNQIDSDYTSANMSLEIINHKKQQPQQLKQYLELDEPKFNRQSQHNNYPESTKNEKSIKEQPVFKNRQFYDQSNELSLKKEPVQRSQSGLNQANTLQRSLLLKKEATSGLDHQINLQFIPRTNYSNDDFELNRKNNRLFDSNSVGINNSASFSKYQEILGKHGNSLQVRTSVSNDRYTKLDYSNKHRNSLKDEQQIDPDLKQADSSSLIEMNYYSSKNSRAFTNNKSNLNRRSNSIMY